MALISFLVSFLILILNVCYCPPPLLPPQDVVQTFIFFSSGPFKLSLTDRFCAGSSFSAFDNDVFLGNTVSLPDFCGINVSDYNPIVYPVFAHVDYDLPAGNHNLTIVVFDSPTLVRGLATLQILLKPNPGTKVLMWGNWYDYNLIIS